VRASQEYVDVHCWAFSRDGFAEVARELREIGLFDFEIESLESNPATQTGHGSEFYVKLRPTAPPRPSLLRARTQPMSAPNPDPDAAPGLSDIEQVRAHADRAFREAVAVQDALKAEKEALEAAMARAVAHGEKAFREAVAAQDVLKAETEALEAAMARAVVHGEKAFREAVAAQDVLEAEKALAEDRLARLEASPLVKLGGRLGLLPR
jgi:hypothetical protein